MVMTPTANLLASLESVFWAGVETAVYRLLALAACALAIASVVAVALHVPRRFAARRQSMPCEGPARSAQPDAEHGSRRVRPRSNTSRSITPAWPIAAAVVVAAGDGSSLAPDAQTKAGAPAVVTITATDYAYEAPATVTAGVNVFRLVNHGDQVHAATIVRLDAGKTVTDYIDAYREAHLIRGARPTWATFRGGPVAIMHGEGSVTLSLEPGNYAWVCFVPGPDGVSHLLKHNQVHAFAVRPRSGDTPAPSVPKPTVTLRMLDYSFELSAPIKAGRHVIRVDNLGADYHHVLLFRLTTGKTMQDVQGWMRTRMEGEAPAAFVAAVGELSTGTDAYLEVDLTAGDYVLLCVITGRDQVTHDAKGMVQQIRVG
jgi:hypothetical protein